MGKKIRVTIDIPVRETNLSNAGVSIEELKDSLKILEHDVIDGLEITRDQDLWTKNSIKDFDILHFFFLDDYNARIVNKEIIMDKKGD